MYSYGLVVCPSRASKVALGWKEALGKEKP